MQYSDNKKHTMCGARFPNVHNFFVMRLHPILVYGICERLNSSILYICSVNGLLITHISLIRTKEHSNIKLYNTQREWLIFLPTVNLEIHVAISFIVNKKMCFNSCELVITCGYESL